MLPRDIQIRQQVRAPLEQIWEACASPKGIVNWQADDARGDARRGGKLTLHWSAFDATVELDVVDLIPYQRMVLSNGSSTVEFHFEDEEVTLTHRGLALSDDMEGMSSSWRVALAQLAHSLERHAGRRRRVYWLVRPVHASPEMLHTCFTQPELLSQWLTDEGSIGEEGSAYEIRLKSGLQLSGQVLANVLGRDLGLSCSNIGESMLSLRSMPAPEHADTRLLACVWSEWGLRHEQADELMEELDSALDRLVSLTERGGRS
jgi:uncharacterized protein YndB with AHSA1/START domain